MIKSVKQRIRKYTNQWRLSRLGWAITDGKLRRSDGLYVCWEMGAFLVFPEGEEVLLHDPETHKINLFECAKFANKHFPLGAQRASDYPSGLIHGEALSKVGCLVTISEETAKKLLNKIMDGYNRILDLDGLDRDDN